MSNKKSQPQRAQLGLRHAFSIFSRLFKRIFFYSPGLFFLAIITILLSSAAGVIGSLFTGTILVDQFIEPMLRDEPTAMFGIPMNIGTAILLMAAVYAIGIICCYVYQMSVCQIGQGTQKKIRDELFSHMESLPL